ncbi:MAG TPA: tetratricopeptide repeat protein [Thermoanaerobaculia bacterium]|nr:tetratricopeptide repeat protein [Thermoanaerobaculia bacterium]
MGSRKWSEEVASGTPEGIPRERRLHAPNTMTERPRVAAERPVGARPSRWAGALLLVLLPGGVPAQDTGSATGLPTVECLRGLRSARVARMREDPETELRLLLAARQPCGERLEWLQGLLDYERRLGLPAAVHDEVHGRLLARLADPALEVPEAVAAHLVYEPDLDPQIRAAVALAFQRRIEGSAAPSIRALRTLAYLQESLGRLDEAAAALERLSLLESGEGSDWTLMRLYRELERWPDAARVTRRIVERGELQASLFHAQLIDLLVRAGDPQGALHELEALERDAGSSTLAGGPGAEVYVSLAWELRDAGLDEQAERLFRRALERPERTGASLLAEIVPQSTTSSSEAALAVLHLYSSAEEREQLAQRAAESAARSDDSFARYEAGTQALTSGKLEEAFDLLSRAAPELPELEAAWHNLALVAYRLKRFAAAAVAYARANALNPRRADGWFFQGLALVSLERCADAVEPLETALRLDPARSLAHYHLAHCYTELGRAEDAERHLQAYQRPQEDGR